ncbi:phasin family protein [Candidatus Bipolaricaulota bacterium]|nr:phasin family protein [Candidatus Bipolaricaulota bacterium]
MLDLAKRVILTGVGLGLVAKDKIDEAIERICEENELTEEESRKLAKELLDETKEARQKLTDLINKATKEVLTSLDIPSRQEFAELDERVRTLEELLQNRDNDTA